jgi:hypothetical protein
MFEESFFEHEQELIATNCWDLGTSYNSLINLMRGAAGRFRAERYPTILGLTAFDHGCACNQGLTKRLVIFPHATLVHRPGYNKTSTMYLWDSYRYDQQLASSGSSETDLGPCVDHVTEVVVFDVSVRLFAHRGQYYGLYRP